MGQFSIEDNGMGSGLARINKYDYHFLGVNGGRGKALSAVRRMLSNHNGKMDYDIFENGAKYSFSVPMSELFYLK